MLKPRVITLQLFVLSLLLFNTNLVSAQDSPFQANRLNNGNPIITPSMFNNSSDGQSINGPSLIRIPSWIPTSQRANASARYYLYFGSHVGDYIRMAWAANIEGPYTLYNNFTSPGNRGVLDNNNSDIILLNNTRIEENHLASPDVIVDNENQRIILYFHSGSSFFVNNQRQNRQVTWVSTSQNGLNFNGNIEPVHLGNSYFRVFPYDGDLYSFGNGGNLNRALNANTPWAIPSQHDLTDALWDRNSNNAFGDDIQVPRSELRVRHTGVHTEGDDLYVFYSRRGEFQERIRLSTIDMAAASWRNWDPSYPPIDILTPNPGWEGGQRTLANSETSDAVNVNQLRDPDVFEDNDGQLYLVYSGNGEGGLGIARLYETPTTNLSLVAVGDAHTRQGSTRNFGSLSNLRTSSSNSSEENRTAYIRFDLSNVSSVQHASVRLYARSSSTGPVTAYRTSSNWTERGITNGNAPSLGAPITTTYIQDDESFYDWNITDYVNDNLGSEIAIAFDVATPNASSHSFGSLQTDQPPTLNITGSGSASSNITSNLARGAQTSQSSTTNSGSSSRAVDGDRNGIFTNRSVTHTSGAVGDWWSVDLGRNATINDIRIFNRTDNCCISRLGNFTVSISNSANGSAVWSRNVTSAPNPSTTLNAGGVTGRFVRITQNLNEPLSLSEVEVRGN